MKALLLLLALSLVGCGRTTSELAEAPPRGEPLPEGAVVFTAAVAQAAARVDVVGTVASEKTVTLSARLGAYVQEVYASAGDRVKAGQVLLSLDDRDIQQQVTAAEAQLKQANREYERVRGLYDKGAMAEQAVTAAEAAFVAAKAHLDSTKVLLTYTQITAPLDGVVTERRVEPGDLASQGQRLLTVFDPTRMRLEVPVPVRLVPAVRLGKHVDVMLDGYPQSLQGEVTEIVSEVDPQTRTRKVKIRLTQTEEILPGTFGRLWVEDAARAAIMVPTAAVTKIGQLEMVHVESGGRMHQRLVRTGPRSGDQVEILSGVNAGDRLVLDAHKGG